MKPGDLNYGSDSADDLRGQGWRVAIHSDYELGGEMHTFWLVTKDTEQGTIALKGEGKFDSKALDDIRDAALLLTQKGSIENQVADGDANSLTARVDYLERQLATYIIQSKRHDENEGSRIPSMQSYLDGLHGSIPIKDQRVREMAKDGDKYVVDACESCRCVGPLIWQKDKGRACLWGCPTVPT